MKQIRLKDRVVKIEGCDGCPIQNTDCYGDAGGDHCNLNADNCGTSMLNKKYPDDCPLEDA